jgi:hypothetical protein
MRVFSIVPSPRKTSPLAGTSRLPRLVRMRVIRSPATSKPMTWVLSTTTNRLRTLLGSTLSSWASRLTRTSSGTTLNLLNGRNPGRGEVDSTPSGASSCPWLASAPRLPVSVVPPAGRPVRSANSRSRMAPCSAPEMKSLGLAAPICSAARSR